MPKEKEQKTAEELVALIRATAPDLRDAEFDVVSEVEHGWTIRFPIDLTNLTVIDPLLEQAYARFVALYDLKN